MLKTEAIKQFLIASGNEHLTSLYNSDMEVQVNVSQDDGKRVDGIYAGKRWVGWKNEKGEQWKSFRIPWSANTEPEYIDKDLTFDLAQHVEGIGMTGWNWKERKSYWVGFDFDSIANHKQGLEDEELENIKSTLTSIDWVTVIRSTSGKGIHVYVFFDFPIGTKNHTEHAGLARSILSVLSSNCGYNFNNSVDSCGGVLWCYHRKQEGTNGLSLLKRGKPFLSSKLPANWQDHIAVTSRQRRKVKSITNDDLAFQEMTSSMKQIPIDEEHKKLLKWFSEKAKKDNWWDSDHNMLVCHTFDLRDAHKELELKGIFYTNSSGSTSQNCYAFPLTNGSWVIRRHSLNVQEHTTWTTDPSGWTRCIYNDIPDFVTCAKANDGVENSHGDFVFKTVREGISALLGLEIKNISIPEQYHARPMFIREKEGKLLISFTRESTDPHIDGFLSTKDKWEKVIHRVKRKKDVYAPDFLIRHVISNNTEAGWWIHARKRWIQQGRANVITVLLSQEEARNKNDIELYMAKAILNPWELVNIPFEEEYPGNRQWNKEAAMLSCKPEEGLCDTWLSVLKHCGQSLDRAVQENMWCVTNAIETGSDYLMCWVASMIQKPMEPLPYLFFYGDQNTGKSTLHEALSLLFRGNRGYIRADNALINQQGFNSEIANAVLCVVEETSLNKNKDAANRIKDWVTGKTISINTKYKIVYDVYNTTHWMQCANDSSYCPIFPGDTRIVVCKVPTLEKEIPKIKLFEKLNEEKAAFLQLLLTIELPEPDGRLSIPCLQSNEKKLLENASMNEVEQFFLDELTPCNGKLIPFDELFYKFQQWLPPNKLGMWSKQRFSLALPKKEPIIKGRYGTENVTYLANASFDFNEKPEDFKFFINEKNRLERSFVCSLS